MLLAPSRSGRQSLVSKVGCTTENVLLVAYFLLYSAMPSQLHWLHNDKRKNVVAGFKIPARDLLVGTQKNEKRRSN